MGPPQRTRGDPRRRPDAPGRRTREEIRKWQGMKRPEKMACVQKAAARMKAIAKKKGKTQ